MASDDTIINKKHAHLAAQALFNCVTSKNVDKGAVTLASLLGSMYLANEQERTDAKVALRCLLIYMKPQSLDWLVVCGATKQKQYTDRLNALIKELPKKKESPDEGGGATGTDDDPEAFFRFGKLGFERFKRKVQVNALSWPVYGLKFLLVWVCVLLYAAGCAVTAGSALFGKFVNPSALSSFTRLQTILLPSIGVASASTFYANVMLMQADVEAFMNKVVGSLRGNVGNLNVGKAFAKCGALFTSLLVAAIFGLITWHFIGFIPAKYAVLKYLLVVGTMATEMMLTYGLLNDEWVPMMRAFFSSSNDKPKDAKGKAAKLIGRFKKLSLPQKLLFAFIFCALAGFIGYGMVALCGVGANVAAHVPLLHQLPSLVVKFALVIAVIAQLPLYLMPAADVSLSLSSINFNAIKQWFRGLGDRLGLVFSDLKGMHKGKFALCWAAGMLATGGAMACIHSVGTDYLFGAHTWYAAVFICLGVGVVYGGWLYLNHFKAKDKYSPVVLNAVVQGSLEKQPLERVAAGFGSLFCCARSELDRNNEKKEIKEEIAGVVSEAGLAA